MTPEAHAAYTTELLERLSSEADVLGLVMLGSSSWIPPGPDAFSDHDFFVVTHPGAQERWRNDLAWLPDAADVVLAFRETPHGVKALYASGHLAEFAVFAPDELALAKVNRYLVLLDRGDIAARLLRVRDASVRSASVAPDLHFHMGQFLTHLVVGVGRAARGERLSGHQLVRGAALGSLLLLLRSKLDAETAARLDDLDPSRRLEGAMPDVGRELDAALQRPVAAVARALLAVATRELADLMPLRARAAVEQALARAEET